MSENPQLVVVIMAGGAGTRFWPMSTEARPKQFLSLFGQRTLLQASYDRVSGFVPPERVLVLTSARFVELVREQLPELPAQNVVGEPIRRDTSAAVALASLMCRERFGDPVMAVLTSDHLIQPVDEFQRTLLSAARGAAGSSALYTIGILPTYPAEGFGYLHRGALLQDDDGVQHFSLQRFKEKPDRVTAERYLESGEYYWNSGMFIWSTSAIMAELERNLPDHIKHLEPAMASMDGPGWVDALTKAFEPLRKISIDFGVMERAAEVRCVGSTFDWSDVGGWLALEEHLDQDMNGNAHRGRLKMHGGERNLVFCEDSSEVVALVGVDDLVVVRSGKVTLVTRRDKTEKIKKLVKKLPRELR